jgi:hypothetical protein
LQGASPTIFWRDFALTDEAVEQMPRKGGFWIAVMAIGAAGAFLLVAAAEWLSGVSRELADGFGTALVVAAVLAGTVDYYLKRGLLQDAWKQLFGYLLPDQVREELDWVSKQELLCERYDLTLKLEATHDPDLMTMQIEHRSDIRNITLHSVDFRPLFALDEWFHEGLPSEVTALRCTRHGETYDQAEDVSPPFAVARELPTMRLAAREQITVYATGHETRHRSDALFMNVTRVTMRPTLTVKVPDGIAFEAMFGQREQGRLEEIAPGVFQLPGTLLPHQVVQVRWWPRDKATV